MVIIYYGDVQKHAIPLEVPEIEFISSLYFQSFFSSSVIETEIVSTFCS